MKLSIACVLLALVASTSAILPRAEAVEQLTENKIRVLLITGGHGFEEKPFAALFDAIPDVKLTHVTYTAAAEMLTPNLAKDYDVLVLYGCPGDGSEIPFGFPKSGHPNRDEYIALVDRYLEAGGGAFVMVYTDSGDKDCRELIEPMLCATRSTRP